MPNSDPDPDDYNPAGPVRTFMAKVQFVNAGPMPPMKVEFPMTETTARDAIANCLLMGRGAYSSPEEWADAVLKRLAHEGYVIVPREPTGNMVSAYVYDMYEPDPRAQWKQMIDVAVKEQTL